MTFHMQNACHIRISVHMNDLLKFVGGLWRGKLTKQTCAAQESLESACLIPVLQLLLFPRSQRS